MDKRCLLNPEQTAGLLAWVRQRPRGGERLHAYFATLYYAGLRPEEAVALNVMDLRLPDEDDTTQWGEIVVHTATPEVGKHWTNSGKVHDERHLKGRAAGEVRVVPAHPALVKILREHITREALRDAALLFQGERGDRLAGSVIRRAWGRAREEVLTPAEYGSPLGRRVYDLRHTCLTTWLNNGIPPADVAEWAGNSVPVLLSTYARCLDGQKKDLQRRIEAAQDLTGRAVAPATPTENLDTYLTRTPVEGRSEPAQTGHRALPPSPPAAPPSSRRHAR
ncbi:tyrosine-type recombinase/integrase [Streptomyces sp. NBRC 109706]|uniref:tyrosine-type recombinase/integrase n=1 Tax=Streptomyces sp. NBRC 109706 TaxID=1550035 RepID=UPI0007862859|nr:tyrosine-type recombinase/integrase [Streptomyces sp. NBRC 109706]